LRRQLLLMVMAATLLMVLLLLNLVRLPSVLGWHQVQKRCARMRR
jgi:hypothetical protein